MDTISHLSPDLLSENILGPNRQDPMKTHLTNARIQVKKSSDFTLFTSEGDRVTLSAFSNLDASAATYNQMGVVDGLKGQSAVSSVSVKQHFSLELTIEGDLNPQEQKDLLKAFKTIEKLASDFFEGDTEKATDRASRISGLSTISRFEAVLQYQKNLSVEQTVSPSAPVRTDSGMQNPPKPAPPMEMPPPVETNSPQNPDIPPAQGPTHSKPELEASDAHAPAEATGHKGIATLVSGISDLLEQTQVEPQKMAKPLEVFLNRLIEKFSGKMRPEDLQAFKMLRPQALEGRLNTTHEDPLPQKQMNPEAESAVSAV